MQQQPSPRLLSPAVFMDPAGLPAMRDAFACHGYEDVLGVLSGQKWVSIVRPGELHRFTQSTAQTTSCFDKSVPDWSVWLRELRAEMAKQKVVTWKASAASKVCYVFRPENVFAAAALSVLHNPLNPKVASDILAKYFGQGIDAAQSIHYCVGTLLGYAFEDVKAWYTGQMLSAFFVKNWYQAYKEKRVDLQVATGIAREFGRHFTKEVAPKWDRALEALCKSDEVAKISKNILIFARPVDAASRSNAQRQQQPQQQQQIQQQQQQIQQQQQTRQQQETSADNKNEPGKVSLNLQVRFNHRSKLTSKKQNKSKKLKKIKHL